ncbi:Pet127-domain-containing protein [Lentinus tigrinus ALCF2SS1-7]|uniref:Pet127-domain-containing protein n=1 Tax=Lentinus tigrinus ALCF2SS1-6 TaxID=1328759 RepID=A0A5C2SEW0_9APHY|nr:Pet127-domain-containing protein [Lentinus tigrinus ALCF2SS1-6]RPD77869.1 Pet127-domain-containing protein [Lentinus tigrinus ALCF2SS1-7]
MKPVASDSKKVDENVVASGLLVDNSFKPLKDVHPIRKKLIPRLAHGLESVVKNREGVHWLKDPESGEYNFDRHLEDVPKVSDFDFDRLGGFVTSSQDKTLIALAKRNKCKYAGSTSSLTGILTQIYLLLSQEKLLNLSNLSSEFETAPRFFTPGQRIPVSVILRYQDGIYTTDYDSERDKEEEEIILLPLGILLEKFLTLGKEEFQKYLKTYTEGDHLELKDVHRYARHGQFLMRSQLDCIHEELPGTGVFDLKTRAISQIRHDVHNYQAYIDCTLDALTGRRGTFEEEYYDMIRSAFLEYSFQARIGNMDGVLVAYHNTARIFGFQYISLREMDLCLFGREGTGDRVFLRCVRIMELLYSQISKCFPERSVKCTFEKRGHYLRAWVEPLEHDDPNTEPPIVELTLWLKNIMHGKPTKGAYAVYSSNYPWTVEYEIKRVEKHQELIRARREIAYKRQMNIARSLPDASPTLLEDDASAASTEPAEAEEGEGVVAAQGTLTA